MGNERINGINPRLRPHTRMMNEELKRPQGWPGNDPMSNRVLDPQRTFETPMTGFPAEIVIGASFNGAIPLPQRCAQIVFINVTPNVWASINGGGPRTIKDGFGYLGEFQSLSVMTDATGGCTIQLAAY